MRTNKHAENNIFELVNLDFNFYQRYETTCLLNFIEMIIVRIQEMKEA